MKQLLVCLIPLILFSACSAKNEKTESTFTFKAAKGGKVYGGQYVFNETSDLPTLDPVQIGDVASHHIAHQIYELLVDLNQKTLEIEPELATRWEISPDGLSYTFTLRSDVYFHDAPCFSQRQGKRLSAQDVKFSFERACDPRTQTKGYWVFKDKVIGANAYFEDKLRAMKNSTEPKIDEIKGLKVVNDSTFKILLKKPFAPFLKTLTTSFCYVVPIEAVMYYGSNFRMQPIGTGPFVFAEHKEGQHLILKKNPRYWQFDQSGNRLPFLDEIKVSFIRDLTTQLMELESGKLSECYRLPEELRPTWIDQEGNLLETRQAKFTLQSIPALSVQYYGFNTRLKPFDDPKIRQAFNYAIDRSKIKSYVLKGGVAEKGIYGLVPPSMPGYQSNKIKGYDFDPQKAQALLTEAGYPNGQGFPETTLQLNSGGGRNLQVAEAIQAMLKENLNIRVNLSIVEWSQHLESVERSKAAFFRMGWIADYPEPENFLNLIYGKLVPGSLDDRSYPNTTRYNNDGFNRLYQKALSTTNDRRRYSLYHQAEQRAINEAPMMMIFYDLDERLLKKSIRDYPINAMDRRDLKTVWLDTALADQKP